VIDDSPNVTVSSNEFGGGEAADVSRLQEAAPACQKSIPDKMDISLLEDSLAKAPWERMQANDDALSGAVFDTVIVEAV